MAAEKLDKNWHGSSFDDNLRLLSGTRSNVGKSPCGFELNQSMRRTKELHKAAHNTGLDYTLDGRIPLFRKQFAELGCGLDLGVDLVGEDTCDHVWQFFIELNDG